MHCQMANVLKFTKCDVKWFQKCLRLTLILECSEPNSLLPNQSVPAHYTNQCWASIDEKPIEQYWLEISVNIQMFSIKRSID